MRYELHDGEVVAVPPARPRHLKLIEIPLFGASVAVSELLTV